VCLCERGRQGSWDGWRDGGSVCVEWCAGNIAVSREKWDGKEGRHTARETKTCGRADDDLPDEGLEAVEEDEEEQEEARGHRRGGRGDDLETRDNEIRKAAAAAQRLAQKLPSAADAGGALSLSHSIVLPVACPRSVLRTPFHLFLVGQP